MANNVDTFYLKQKTVVGRYIASIFGILMGIFSCCFGVYMLFALNQDDAWIGTVVLGAGGIFFLAISIFSLRKMSGGKSFVALSDDGINIDNQVILVWGDIENVEEETYEVSYEYVAVKKKRLKIRYVDQKSAKIREALIVEDYEGYSFIREKVLRKWSESKAS